MRFSLRLLGLLLGLLAGARPAGAEVVAAVPVALLGLEAVEVPPEATQVLGDVLRQQLGAAAGLRLLPGKDLVEVKLIFGCIDERPSCLAQVGQGLGAQRLLYGSVRRPTFGPGYTVILKQLHVPTTRIERFISDTVPTRLFRRDSPELEQLVARWLDVLVLSVRHGGLVVRSDPPGAAVVLDGKGVGTTPLELRAVAPGTHVVRLSLPEHDTAVQSFRVRGGLVHELTVQLRRRAPTVPPPAAWGPAPRPRDPGQPLRLASYFLLGAAALAGGISIYTWRTYVNAQEPARQALDALEGSEHIRNDAPHEVQEFFCSTEQRSSCTPPPALTTRAQGSPKTDAVYQSYLDHCRRGRSYADATTGLLATMGGAVLLGVTSYLVGHVLRPEQRRGGPKAASWGKAAPWRYKPQLLEITPTMGNQSGSVNLSFQF